MHKRCYITLGAATDTGGKVVTASSGVLLDGIPRALEGDLVDCPVCHAQGRITCALAAATRRRALSRASSAIGSGCWTSPLNDSLIRTLRDL